MKRYRLLSFDFDSRAHSLKEHIPDHWEEKVKLLHRQNREQTERSLIHEFGEESAAVKRQNFIDLGPKPVSILAYHNAFFHNGRTAFVMGAYYAALTAAGALGERILNHLILTLRDDFRHTPQYQDVQKKPSFSNWPTMIETLVAWDVLLPAVATEFKTLKRLRNKAVHFDAGLDADSRTPALTALHCLGVILGSQFSAFGPQAWFINGVPGEPYIKKDWEDRPFIKRVYLPHCRPVGPAHVVESVMPWRIRDCRYEDKDITDDQFCDLRRAFIASGGALPQV